MQAKGALVDSQASLGDDAEAVRDGHGDDVAPGLKGQAESTPFEGLKPPIRAPSPLGKDDHRGPASNPLSGRFYALNGLARVLPFNPDVAGSAHGRTQQRDFHQLLLHNKFKIHPQMGQQCKDVKIALMVGHIDAGDFGCQVFLSPYPNLNAANPENDSGPRCRTVEMDLPAISIKWRKQNAIQTEHNTVNGNKGI